MRVLKYKQKPILFHLKKEDVMKKEVTRTMSYSCGQNEHERCTISRPANNELAEWVCPCDCHNKEKNKSLVTVKQIEQSQTN
jgi:hypothetical protein